MAVVIRGGVPSMPLNFAGRYRITWKFVAAPFVPDNAIDSHKIAEAVRNALPPLGLVPVSAISALPGDPFVQYRVQLARDFPGRTVGDLITYADRLPILPVGGSLLDPGTSLRTALDVSEVDILGPPTTAAELVQDDTAARDRAKEAAAAADVAGKIGAGLLDAGRLLLIATVIGGALAVWYLFGRD